MDGCVLYDGPQKPLPNGYFLIWDGIGHRRIYAHRLAWEAIYGPIPTGLTVDHLCGVKPCINVFHMELVTHGENARRGNVGIKHYNGNSHKTHCQRGHPFDEANTYRYTGADGRVQRQCRACHNERELARYHARVVFHD